MAGRIFAALLIFARIAAAAGCKRASPLPATASRLIEELSSHDLRRRQDAAVAPGKVQPMPPEAIKALAEAVKTEEAVRTRTNSGCEKLFDIPVGTPSATARWNLRSRSGTQTIRSAARPAGKWWVPTRSSRKRAHLPAGGGSSPDPVQSSGANRRRAGAGHHLEDVRPPRPPWAHGPALHTAANAA